jgi:phytoene synthase
MLPGISTLDESLIKRAAAPGSMRYFSVLYAPQDKREAMLAIYLIDAEIRESAHGANHDIAHTRLRWWREEIDRLINGGPQHPGTRILHAHIQDRAVLAKLHELLAAADMDLVRMTFLDARELRAYATRSSGVVTEVIAALLNMPQSLDETLRASSQRIGIGVRLVEIVRDVRQNATDGLLYLPMDEMQRQQLNHEALRAREVSHAARIVLKHVSDQARNELSAAEQSLTASQKTTLRPLLVLSALHRKLLDRIAAKHYDVATERIELNGLTKPWTAWKAARNAST